MNTRRKFLKQVGIGTLALSFANAGMVKNNKPNVIIILTDDQGYGEVAIHGNPRIKTPNLDKLYTESVRLNNFHVSNVCAPSRASIMTGKYSSHVGVWHTLGSREIIRREETLMPEIFANNDYKTAMVGKWHNGDNYPFRPQDRGFDEVFQIGGGSPGQVPDYWGNGIFDMRYWNGNEWELTEGFSTDVQFDRAIKFISKNKTNQFFCYIATTAPHSPIGAPQEYLDMYSNEPNGVREFYGMVTNIDWNLGRLRKYLTKNKLDDNTILIFMTDNGSACDKKNKHNTFNGGMRGKKGSAYDGGHRVPCFVYWPEGKFEKGVDANQLTAHIDLLPTLIDACSMKNDVEFDGVSLLPVLKDPEQYSLKRTLVTEGKVNNRQQDFTSCTVMTDKWRLLNKGKELYQIQDDPSQKNDLAEKFPNVKKELQDEYHKWLKKVSVVFNEDHRIIIGSEHEKNTTLFCMDVYPIKGYSRGKTVWNQKAVKKGEIHRGIWKLEVDTSGSYEFSLRRWPKESELKFGEIPAKAKNINFQSAKLNIKNSDAGKTYCNEMKEVQMKNSKVSFTVELPRGIIDLDAILIDEKGVERTAYYVDVELVK